MIDLDGGASVLFPHTIDQDPAAFDGNGWVTSLDWTPGAIRYQADRKVNSGTKIKGLRSLELSEGLEYSSSIRARIIYELVYYILK